jgi:hypothetical protein
MSSTVSIIDGVYVEDTVGLDPAKDKQMVANIASSVYNVVILSFLHTHPKSPNNLYFNETQLYRDGPGLDMVPYDPALLKKIAALVAQIKSGPTKPRVLFSMGPQQTDYDQIANAVPQFVGNLYQMAQQLGFDGYDFDYEGEQDGSHAKLVANLATQYWHICKSKGASLPTITAAPFYGQDWWASVLTHSVVATGNAFSWFNVQFYAGGNISPDDGALVFGYWENAIAKGKNGILNASQFIVPGVSADPNTGNPYTPANFTAMVSNIYGTYPDIGGGFVWKYGYVAADIVAWSEAPYEGIGPDSTARISKAG